jgi:hypothetical protein
MRKISDGRSDMKNENWSFLAETKQVAIDMLVKQQRLRPGQTTISEKDYSLLIKQIEDIDLTMPPPRAQHEVIADGSHWIIRVSYQHEHFGDHHYVHKLSATREVIAYGLYRRIE